LHANERKKIFAANAIINFKISKVRKTAIRPACKIKGKEPYRVLSIALLVRQKKIFLMVKKISNSHNNYIKRP